MSNPAEIITNAIATAVADKAPELLGDAIRSAAGEGDDPLAAATLNLLAGLVEEHGPEAVTQLTDQVVDLIKGENPMAAFALKGKPDELDALVSALQTAEAERKAEAAKWAQAAGAALRDFAAIAASAIGSALAGK